MKPQQITIVKPEVPIMDLFRGLQEGRYDVWLGKQDNGTEFYTFVEKELLVAETK
jgi:hypothetical protein